MKLRIHLILAVSVGLASCTSTGGGGSKNAPPLPDYGEYERAIDGASQDVQSWFDRGLTLVYGFNHEEGIKAFARAAELDPSCAMAWWGVAYGNGVDVNNMEVSDDEARLGAEAAQMALGLLDEGPSVERALAEAVAERAVWPMPEDRSSLDEAYAERMGAAWRAYPKDPDVGCLYAEALMNLQPWDYWEADGEARGRANEIVAVLERVFELAPDHPGANHFYIHAVEASSDPERALPAAAVLETRIPGSGHLVHMPSHVYITTGQYDRAVRSNQAAIAVDETYFEANGRPAFYSLYFLHNIHFLAFAAMMEGRFQTALDAVRRMEDEVPEPFLREFTGYADGLLPAVFHVLVRFGRWEDILAEPEYPEFRRASRAVRRYGRTIALANLGRTDEARAELEAFDVEAAAVPEGWTMGTNPASVVLALSRQVAEGEVLFKEGREDEAFAVLEAAQVAEDALVYDEPPGWMLPVRHARGALLIAAGQPAAAERVYREDLEEWPRNGWSLLGLQQALRALGKSAEADLMEQDVKAAWIRADVTPPASCYCAASPD